MPITRSAKKKLRQDKKRERNNLSIKRKVKKTINAFKRNPSEDLLKKVYSLLDSAKKKKIFHINKTARLKSKLTKLFDSKSKEKKTESISSSKKRSPKKRNPLYN